MVSAISSTTSAVTAASLSSSGNSGKAAQLKAELADKQSQISQARTDQEKAELNAEISQLKAEISDAQTTGGSGNSPSASADSNGKADDDRHKGRFNTADKAASESRMSSANMDVLMRMGQKGGMMPRSGMGGPQDISRMYASMDGDADGKVTRNEFVSANAGRMGKDEAGKIYDSIDTDNTGAITEDQFAQSLKEHEHEGGSRMGPPPGGRPMWGDEPDGSTADRSATIA